MAKHVARYEARSRSRDQLSAVVWRRLKEIYPDIMDELDEIGKEWANAEPQCDKQFPPLPPAEKELVQQWLVDHGLTNDWFAAEAEVEVRNSYLRSVGSKMPVASWRITLEVTDKEPPTFTPSYMASSNPKAATAEFKEWFLNTYLPHLGFVRIKVMERPERLDYFLFCCCHGESITNAAQHFRKSEKSIERAIREFTQVLCI